RAPLALSTSTIQEAVSRDRIAAFDPGGFNHRGWGQHDAERATRARNSNQLDRSAMLGDDFLADRQPQPRPSSTFPGLEQREHFFAVRGIDPWAVIGNF